MNKACGVFSASTLDGALAKLAGTVLLPELQLVARTFRQLQQERHSADYDMTSHWTRLRTKENIQASRNAIAAWNKIRKLEQANIFALALLDLNRVQTARG